jgi:hypothetical protein
MIEVNSHAYTTSSALSHEPPNPYVPMIKHCYTGQFRLCGVRRALRIRINCPIKTFTSFRTIGISAVEESSGPHIVIHMRIWNK